MPITQRNYRSPAYDQMREGNLATFLQGIKGGAESSSRDELLNRLILGEQLKEQGEVAKEASKSETAFNTAEEITKRQGRGTLPSDSNITINGVTIGKPPVDPAIKAAADLQKERLGFGKEAQVAYKDLPASTETVELLNQYLDDPNSFNDKKIAILQARLAEGKGQRLLQSVIQSFGNKASGLKTTTDMFNYLSGQAKSGIPDEQRNAMRKSSFDVATQTQRDYEDITSQLKARGVAVYPGLATSGGIDPIIEASGSQVKSSLGRIKALQDKYNAAAPAQVTPPAYQAPRGITEQGIDKLKSYFGGPAAATSSTSGNLSPSEQTELESLKKQLGR